MKNTFLFFYSMLLISSFTHNNTTHYPFINKLSNDSKIKLICQTHQSPLFELSKIESVCSTLNHRLKLLFNDQHAISDFLVVNRKEAYNDSLSIVLSEHIEDIVETILKNESDSIKFKEYANIYRAIANHQIKNKVNNKRMDQKGKFIIPQSPTMQ